MYFCQWNFQRSTCPSLAICIYCINMSRVRLQGGCLRRFCGRLETSGSPEQDRKGIRPSRPRRRQRCRPGNRILVRCYGNGQTPSILLPDASRVITRSCCASLLPTAASVLSRAQPVTFLLPVKRPDPADPDLTIAYR
ncbi:UNVERIFIED_CONTAM: hypothetical protein PYX00_010501 [Menopon gallinae]|uniref:Uncharacterized protein n=1 Tax=Menopon gallinae TaxID=328185 RepID=A0AAW2HFN2_9NEOP